MPDVEAQMEFLARLPLYESEKPYLLLPLKGSGLDPDEIRLDNLEFESHDHINIKDMRQAPGLSIDTSGFEFYQHDTAFRTFESSEDINRYMEETEEVLKKRFSAVHVVTYDARLRRNENLTRREFDMQDKMTIEAPAKGAHVGTYYRPSGFHNVPITKQMLLFSQVLES